MNRDKVVELILILFPYWNHFDWSKVEIHHGEYRDDKFKHSDSIYNIEFKSPACDKDLMQVTIFSDGIRAWKNSNICALSGQFTAYKFLKKNLKKVL